ncbi:1-acyl-sn-glycerol-3-phosphate acyltransferase [Nostocoides sp. HKS02]|uniref:lysophospholipid acyltransferase family protein n=1 Tax=Nostocoides sp. HKS02 TaxID=1813880 RepID=UPI0018A83C66|nr:lysophospholipid acyltransferase family protein [Tetrasphaera sp. HKS02]
MSDVTYRLVIRACRGVFRVLGLRIEVHGDEHLPTTGAVVVVANHHSFIDFMLVGLVGTRRRRFIRFLAKQVVFDLPVVGSAMRRMGHVPVDRAHGEVAARQALRALQAGEAVGIYPEATIGRAFTVRDRAYWRHGAAHLALATGAPLVPVAHWGAHRVVTVGGRISLRRGTAVQVLVGAPIVPRPGENAEQLTTRAHALIEAMVESLVAAYPQPPRDPGRAWWWPAIRGGAAPCPQECGHLEEAVVRGMPSVRGAGVSRQVRARGRESVR